MFGSIKNLFGSKEETPGIEYWVGDIGLTLMTYNYEYELHVQTEIRRYAYFFKVLSDLRSSMLPPDFENRLKSVAEEIYYGHRLHFQQAEPDDVNYIAIVETSFRQLNQQEIPDKIWLSAQPPHWESSHCNSVSAETFAKENPETY
jgi:hypothetical protein